MFADLPNILEDLNGGIRANAPAGINVLTSRQGYSFCPAAQGVCDNPFLHVLSMLPSLHKSVLLGDVLAAHNTCD